MYLEKLKCVVVELEPLEMEDHRVRQRLDARALDGVDLNGNAKERGGGRRVKWLRCFDLNQRCTSGYAGTRVSTPTAPNW